MILQTGLTPTPEDEEDHDRHRPADGQKRDPQGLEPLGEGSLEPSVLEDLEASGFVPSPPPTQNDETVRFFAVYLLESLARRRCGVLRGAPLRRVQDPAGLSASFG